ncbi:phosphatidate cytidylyltransferase [Vibrio algarum]|uniref:Phosphatidate cytidylyltransferase n=1 Tax=Vibrio algarum TaxID=3020714 RepID=A0ABT4YST2_9VIBR|nr:phosphatidate cytidylyltransferase [Vibrio sp. KJ40-1]MDB1124613.1 phosphatidate cytidylyltransferase [Vibrio sp. KJ40-1]
MKQRIITALILAPLAVLAIFELPLPLFLLVVTGITLLAFWEWAQFVGSKSRYLAMIPTIACLAISYWLMPSDVDSLNQLTLSHVSLLVVASIWWLVASALAITFPKSTNYWQDSKFLRQLFGVLTILPFFWSLLILRAQNIEIEPYHGSKLVLFVCLLVWAADSGAYFAGKAFGKHKMAPNVSPNKTIEGLVGGIVVALVVGWLTASFFDIHFSSFTSMVIITLVTVIISVLGDLVESMLKRVSGIKDSSNIIPGHGGVLDRIDSLTAAFPVFTLLYFTI